MKNEIERLRDYKQGEVPPALWVQLRAVCQSDSALCLERIRSVLLLVIQQRQRNWPDDAEWRKLLPDWLVDSFDKHSLEEIVSNPDLWEFGSWLDAMTHTGWEWWSSEQVNSTLSINLCAFEDPYSMGPLEYLVRAAGANEIQMQEM